jgi:hypothetical protein
MTACADKGTQMKTIITLDNNPATYCEDHINTAIDNLATNSIAYSVDDAPYGECITCQANLAAIAVANALASLDESATG